MVNENSKKKILREKKKIDLSLNNHYEDLSNILSYDWIIKKISQIFF